MPCHPWPLLNLRPWVVFGLHPLSHRPWPPVWAWAIQVVRPRLYPHIWSQPLRQSTAPWWVGTVFWAVAILVGPPRSIGALPELPPPRDPSMLVQQVNTTSWPHFNNRNNKFGTRCSYPLPFQTMSHWTCAPSDDPQSHNYISACIRLPLRWSQETVPRCWLESCSLILSHPQMRSHLQPAFCAPRNDPHLGWSLRLTINSSWTPSCPRLRHATSL